MEELGLDHQLVLGTFNRDGTKGFAQNTPTGNYPYFEDGDVTLSESGAIVQYILETYGNGRLEPPVGSPYRPAYLHWLHFSEGTAANPINLTVWLTVYRQDADKHSAIIDASKGSANHIFDGVESALSNQTFLVSDEFTAADIMMGFTLISAMYLQVLTDSHPRTVAYVNRLLARPCLQRTLAVGN